MKMTEREAAIKRLEGIKDIYVMEASHPYAPNAQGTLEDIAALDMALDALTAQAPRVLTLQTAGDTVHHRDPVLVWIERRKQGDISPYVFYWRGTLPKKYGTEYRYWIGGKPTAEQMSAEPWKKGEE
jgi:hypothetical protein